MSRNHKRAIVCNRVRTAGFTPARIVSAVSGESLSFVADTLLKMKGIAVEHHLGDQAMFTGNTRTFANGAIADEIRCSECGGLFWETGLPYAKCVDCK